MVIDSVAMTTEGDSSIYFEMYKVIPLEKISNQNSSDLVVELSDGTYLIPSGGDYQLDYLLGNGDTTYALTDNYSDYVTIGSDPFETRQPMYLRIGIAKRWNDQAVLAMDLVTGFLNRFSTSTTWRLSIGAEITRFKNNILRLGYAIGGVERKSLSFGYGTKIGSIYFDIGLALNGGFSLDSAKGIDMAAGIIWQFR